MFVLLLCVSYAYADNYAWTAYTETVSYSHHYRCFIDYQPKEEPCGRKACSSPRAILAMVDMLKTYPTIPYEWVTCLHLTTLCSCVYNHTKSYCNAFDPGSILMIGDSLGRNQMNYWNKQCYGNPDPRNGSTVQFIRMNTVDKEKMSLHHSTISRAKVVVINTLFHMLHLYPLRIPEKNATQENIEEILMFLQFHYNSTIVWETSNTVCVEKYTGNYKNLIDKYVHERQAMGNSDVLRTTFDRYGSIVQNSKAISFIRQRFPDVRFIDGLRITDYRCEFTGYNDGRHFRQLVHIKWMWLLHAFIL